MNINPPTNFGEPSRRKAEDFLALIHQQKQDELKIYLGACAGVGKTYQMLVEGNRLKKRGLDVVIGYVEPHARSETTAQIGGLEVVPPLVFQYRGVELREMDTASVITRAPTVALVDELAHPPARDGTERERQLPRPPQRAEEASPDEHKPGGVGQVAVALSSGGPDPGAILRKTARLASQLNAPWYAVYVRTPGEAPRIITAEAQRAIGETLETAQRMGGIVTVLKRDEVAAALIDFARGYGITHCVVGRPSERPFWQRLRLSLHEKLLQELEGVDLVVV